VLRRAGAFLEAGDVLVVNTSATLPAALPGVLNGRPMELHLSTPADPGSESLWVVEPRTSDRGRCACSTPG
jgi:S-adenosylmethionine:tRNA ribosyltransferase-isomerase